MATTEDRAIARGSGKWGDPDVPKLDWVCEDIVDHEDTDRVCDMCESKHIRYEHRMWHPDYPDVLGVGCICAGNMEQDLDSAIARQKEAVKAAQKRMRQRVAEAKRKATIDAMLTNISNRVEFKMDDRARFRASAERSLKGWYETRTTGNPILHCLDFRCIVFPKKKGHGYGYMVAQADAPPAWSKATYADEDTAKAAAREALLDAVVASEMESI